MFPRPDGAPWTDYDYRNWRKRNYRPASDTIEYTSSLPAGATKRIEYPVAGFQVSPASTATSTCTTRRSPLQATPWAMLPALTAKDLADIAVGLDIGVDYIALSFVREAKDLMQLKAVISHADRKPLIIAKIEDQQAVKNLNEIICEADGIMVARGDLGVEMGPETVPVLHSGDGDSTGAICGNLLGAQEGVGAIPPLAILSSVVLLEPPLLLPPLSLLQPPTVFRDYLFVGWAGKDWEDTVAPPGNVFALDARSGERRWTFDEVRRADARPPPAQPLRRRHSRRPQRLIAIGRRSLRTSRVANS